MIFFEYFHLLMCQITEMINITIEQTSCHWCESAFCYFLRVVFFRLPLDLFKGAKQKCQWVAIRKLLFSPLCKGSMLRQPKTKKEEANFHVGATNYQVIYSMNASWCKDTMIASFAIDLNYRSIKSSIVLPCTNSFDNWSTHLCEVYIEFSFTCLGITYSSTTCLRGKIAFLTSRKGASFQPHLLLNIQLRYVWWSH